MIQLNRLELAPQARIHIRACLCKYVMQAVGVYSVYTPLSNCRYCVPAIRNPTIQNVLTEDFVFLKNLIHCSSFCEGCRHHEFNCQTEFCHDVDDEDAVCGRSPCCSVYHFPSCLPINNAVIIYTSFEVLIRILTPLFSWVDGCIELPFCCHEFVL